MATFLSVLLLFACASTSSSNPNSCKGRCGEGYYRGSFCQCDYECLGLNECCTDFQDLCTSKDSCKGRCGEPFNRGNPCHCDIDCVPYGQCCPDYESMCLTEESSNEEMINEEGIGEELKIPEDKSESTPSEGSEISSPYAGSDIELKVGGTTDNEETTPEPNSSTLASSLPPSGPSLTPTADASDMLSAYEIPIESTTQQPSEEMTTSSTPQPQENVPTEGPTSMAPTEGPTSTAPTEGPASTASTEGPASTAPTEGPTTTAPTEDPTSTAPTEGPTTTAPTEGPTTMATTEDPTSTAPTEGPTTTAPTEDPTTTAPTEGPTTTAPTEGPTTTAPTEDPTSTAPTEGPTTTAPTEGPTTMATTEDPTSTAPTEGPTTTAPTEGPASTAPTEGLTSMAPTEGPTSTAPTDGPVTTMGQGEDPKESSSLKDSRATSIPKTLSTLAPVKPSKKPNQPSTDKDDRPVKPLKPSLDKDGKTDSIKDYQADDYDTNLCSGRPISGLTTLRNGTIVVFRGHYFWTLDKHRNPDPPQLITRVWGIPSPIDTVYTRCNCQGKTYFFKGKNYWRFENGVMDSGFPKSVSQGFGQIGHITAALSIPEYRSRKESVIFFKRGGMAQRYTYQVTPNCGKRPGVPVFTWLRTRRQATAALGKMITISKDWRGFPTMVTSAVSVPSRVKEGYKYYVFSQRNYYSIKLEREKPVILKPAIGPKENSANSFFKCQETQKN